MDHCVQVIGYDAKKKIWTVRNQWGANWGVDGYIQLKAGQNTCGMALEATVVTAEKAEQKAQKIAEQAQIADPQLKVFLSNFNRLKKL